MARCFAPTETCPERDKFGRTRPYDDRSYTPTSIHTEHGCVTLISMSISSTQSCARSPCSHSFHGAPPRTRSQHSYAYCKTRRARRTRHASRSPTCTLPHDAGSRHRLLRHSRLLPRHLLLRRHRHRRTFRRHHHLHRSHRHRYRLRRFHLRCQPRAVI
jgi:hypothetical protein